MSNAATVDNVVLFLFCMWVVLMICLYFRNKFRHSKLLVKIKNREWDDVDNVVFAKMISEGEVSGYTYNSYYVVLEGQRIIVSTSRERKAVTCIRMCTNIAGDKYDRVVRGKVDGGILYEILMEKFDKQEQEVFNTLKREIDYKEKQT